MVLLASTNGLTVLTKPNQEGAQYSLKDDISHSAEFCVNDLKALIKKGNNSSTKLPENFNALKSSYTKEVEKS